MKSINRTKLWGLVTCVCALLALPLSARTVRIYVANHAGGSVYVIDPTTDKVIQVIEGIDVPHGVTFSPDGSRVYVSSESEKALDVIDQKTGKIIKQVPLSGLPNNIAITKDGKRVLVCIRSGPGALDVVDTTSLKLVKSIPVKGGLHNGYVTPDGKYAVVGSIVGKVLTVIDLQTEEGVWEVNFDKGVRPMAIEINSDGSTRRIFVQLHALHGFAVVDFSTHQEVARIKLPDEPSGGKEVRGELPLEPNGQRLGVSSHGIGVSPDGKTLWVNSHLASAVFVYSLPDLNLLGYVRTGEQPDWITFTPDSTKAYISNSGANSVSAIDMKTLKEVARIPVGEVPQRNATLVLP